MNGEQISGLLAEMSNPVYGMAAAGVLVAVLAWTARRTGHPVRRPLPRSSPPEPPQRKAASRRGEDLLTFVAAMVATGVAAQGMWNFFHDVLQMPKLLAATTFAFLELAMFTSALRARRNVSEFGSAGLDGVAVWVFTCLSATLATLDASSVREVPARVAAPLVAAWLWERGLAVQRRRGVGRRWHWRIAPERVLVRLGLAEPSDRTVGEVTANRYLNRVAKAAKRLRQLQRTGAKPRAQLKALARLEAAVERAIEHVDLATDPVRRRQLLARIELLYSVEQLAELTPTSPWPSAAHLTDSNSGTDAPATAKPQADTVKPDTDAYPAGQEAAVPDTGADRTRPSRTRRTRTDGVPALSVVPDVPADSDPQTGDASEVQQGGDGEVYPPLGDEPVREQAAQLFADDLRAGQVPSIRRIKAALRCGQTKASRIRAYLETLPAEAVADTSAS